MKRKINEQIDKQIIECKYIHTCLYISIYARIPTSIVAELNMQLGLTGKRETRSLSDHSESRDYTIRFLIFGQEFQGRLQYSGYNTRHCQCSLLSEFLWDGKGEKGRWIRGNTAGQMEKHENKWRKYLKKYNELGPKNKH